MAFAPYGNQYEHIKDIDQFFKYDPVGKTMTFIGQSLKCYIPSRYEVYDLLTISDTVTSLGILDMVINDKYHAGLLMLTTIEMEQDDVSKYMLDDIPYFVVTLSTGNKFICNTERIADKAIAYAIWTEFLMRGKLIYNIDYDTLSTLFDQSGSMCDANINVDRCVFEMIYSHLCRNPDNLTEQYRHTDMSKPYDMIPLRSVGYATTSTTSRLLGSYFGESLNASLIQVNDKRTDVEDLLRS